MLKFYFLSYLRHLHTSLTGQKVICGPEMNNALGLKPSGPTLPCINIILHLQRFSTDLVNLTICSMKIYLNDFHHEYNTLISDIR
jgi:hypothetical protein